MGREKSGVNGGMKKRVQQWLKREVLLSHDYRGDRVTYNRHWAQRVVVKWAVKVAKRMAVWQWGERLGNYFEGNIMMFWKEVK